MDIKKKIPQTLYESLSEGYIKGVLHDNWGKYYFLRFITVIRYFILPSTIDETLLCDEDVLDVLFPQHKNVNIGEEEEEEPDAIG